MQVTEVHCGKEGFQVKYEDTHADGVVVRSFTVPWKVSQRLLRATDEQRCNAVIVGDGSGITWPEADEDLGLRGLRRDYEK